MTKASKFGTMKESSGVAEPPIEFGELDEKTAAAWAEIDRRSFPRRLHVRIDAIVEASDDGFLSREIADAIAHAMRVQYFRDGGQRFNEVARIGRVRLRFRYWNRYGPNWFWILWNKWDRRHRGWGRR